MSSLRCLPIACCVALFAGCEVAAVDPLPRASVSNECDGEGRGCTEPADVSECRDGRRVACQGGFSTILLEINAPASGGLGSGLSYLWREDGVDLKGENWEILLPQVATVEGTVRTAPYVMYPSTDTPCQLLFEGSNAEVRVAAGLDRSIPVTVSFTPADRVLGVSSAGYLAEVETEAYESADPVAPERLEFQVKVPPGEYDVYVEPRKPAEGGCEFPPYLLRRGRAQSGSVPLDIELPVPSRFELTVPAPAAANGAHMLEGWTVDMLDPISGRVISTSPKLEPTSDDELGATVFYFPVALAADQSELVRLSPPDDVTAPTIVLARSALELFSVGSGVVANFEGYPAPVRVEGQVAVAGGAPASATVTLTATSIEGVGEGVFATLVRTLQVGPEGTFETDLLPGTYRVLAVPGGEQNSGEERASAATQVEWVIAAEPLVQAGKVVELQPIKHIRGNAFLPGSDEPVLGAVVTAVASPREVQVDLLRQAAEGSFRYAPSAQSSAVGADGAFDVSADPGDFDISVRPADGSGFAWGVRHVTLRQEDAEVSLGAFMLPFPVPYTGRVRVVDTAAADSGAGGSPASEAMVEPLSQALIRAYVYLDEGGTYIDEPTEAAAVVQVAETRANINGEFELLIPANLN